MHKPAYYELFQQLTTESLVLTVNKRLSMLLQEYAADYYTQQGLTAWATPNIMPITAWFEQCWHAALYGLKGQDLVLLSACQEQLLWQQIITSNLPDSAIHSLFNLAATAELACQTWQLVKQWNIDYNDISFSQSEDSATWQKWAQEFVKYCQQQKYLDQNSLPDWLTTHGESSFAHIRILYLIGFDEIIPQYQTFFQQLEQQGIIIKTHTIALPAKVDYLALEDQITELRSMACWAQHLRQQGAKRIGCVIPNLKELRDQVENIFTEICAPECLLPSMQRNLEYPFTISAGITLKDYPLIHDALLFLSLKEPLAIEKLSAILRSPYCGEAEQEMLIRARLDAKLRSTGEAYLALDWVLKTTQTEITSSLLSRLENYFNQLNQIILKPLSYSQWARFCAEQLKILGWPGERVLNSTEYQIVESWFELLDEFASLDITGTKINWPQALSMLNYLAGSRQFQPQTTWAPIQIVGVLEAAGISFEHLWIAGLDDHTWPPLAHPNPFIPHSLQRRFQLPHASSERELHYCQVLTHRLMQSAEQVIISYHQLKEDQLLRPSPLMEWQPLFSFNNLSLPPYFDYISSIYESRLLEEISDEVAPPVIDAGAIKGGSSIFKAQAHCPFQAYARYRLGANSLGYPILGLSPKERGSLLHAALAALWQQLESQHHLQSYTEHQLQVLIAGILEDVLKTARQIYPYTFQPQFILLEQQRLCRLLTSWLQLEKQRPPFTVIATEQSETYFFAGIHLNLRADRIDRLENGDYIVIDYKTGSTNINDWFTSRPGDPQLPLYGVLSKKPIKALIFAEVRSMSQQFKGISAADYKITGVQIIDKGCLRDEVPTEWEALLQHWQQVLTNLARQFQQGVAHVEPKEGKETCKHCDLPLLCRLRA